MTYIQIVNLVFDILTWLYGAILFHYVIFGAVGLFFKKRFPKTEEKLKYGVIIPARNEEAVVANLIESVKKCKYPQDKLQIFVIAHNCTDRTAEVSREHGATVYEYNNPEECTMGYAFRYLFDRIREDWGVENYDGFFLFNADNVLDEMFFDKMNDAFIAEGRTNIITSLRNSKNFGSNVVSAMYGLYFLSGCVFESRGRTALNCSTRVQGTGYVIPAELVKDGWQYVTLTEDWEFTADQILENNKIVFCDEAIFYDEQPTNLRVSCRQRLRWAKGHLLVCITRFKDLLKGLFKPKKKGGVEHKVSTYDIFVNILPICVISSSIFILRLVFIAVALCFGEPIDAFLNTLIGIGSGLVSGYLTGVLTAILLYIFEGKRIKKVPLWLKIVSTLLFPIFLFLSIPLEFVALFTKKVGWKTIPHEDTTTFENVNEKEECECAESKTEDLLCEVSAAQDENDEKVG